MVVALFCPQSAEARRARATRTGPVAGAELAVSDLGWPDDTSAAKTTRRARVLAAPSRGKRLATVVAGTPVTWRRIVASADRCRAWIELEPRGWACARDLAPTATVSAPAPPLPSSSSPSPRRRWADVRKSGADVYTNVAAIAAGAPSKVVDDKTYVALRGSRSVRVDGVSYVKTDQGWIAARSLSRYSPSDFAGLELTPTTALDFAWAVARRPGRPIAVRDAPNANATQLRELAPRDRVTVHQLTDGFARISAPHDDAEWVDAAELRRPAKQPRPSGVAADEKWIDIDIDHQTAVLYEGDTPVFVTLVSTGKSYGSTPTGIFRIHNKEPVARMQNREGQSELWNVADVPYSMPFRRDYALHGAYWHDGFGRRRSHGCINLSLSDAKRIYEWVTPHAPAGWTRVVADGDGTPVQIRSLRDPTPRWRSYDGTSVPPTRAARRAKP